MEVNISPQAVQEYRNTYAQVFGEQITTSEALEQATRLMGVFQVVYRPIPIASNSKKKGGDDSE